MERSAEHTGRARRGSRPRVRGGRARGKRPGWLGRMSLSAAAAASKKSSRIVSMLSIARVALSAALKVHLVASMAVCIFSSAGCSGRFRYVSAADFMISPLACPITASSRTIAASQPSSRAEKRFHASRPYSAPCGSTGCVRNSRASLRRSRRHSRLPGHDAFGRASIILSNDRSRI